MLLEIYRYFSIVQRIPQIYILNDSANPQIFRNLKIFLNNIGKSRYFSIIQRNQQVFLNNTGKYINISRLYREIHKYFSIIQRNTQIFLNNTEKSTDIICSMILRINPQIFLNLYRDI